MKELVNMTVGEFVNKLSIYQDKMEIVSKMISKEGILKYKTEIVENVSKIYTITPMSHNKYKVEISVQDNKQCYYSSKRFIASIKNNKIELDIAYSKDRLVVKKLINEYLNYQEWKRLASGYGSISIRTKTGKIGGPVTFNLSDVLTDFQKEQTIEHLAALPDRTLEGILTSTIPNQEQETDSKTRVRK